MFPGKWARFGCLELEILHEHDPCQANSIYIFKLETLFQLGWPTQWTKRARFPLIALDWKSTSNLISFVTLPSSVISLPSNFPWGRGSGTGKHSCLFFSIYVAKISFPQKSPFLFCSSGPRKCINWSKIEVDPVLNIPLWIYQKDAKLANVTAL